MNTGTFRISQFYFASFLFFLAVTLSFTGLSCKHSIIFFSDSLTLSVILSLRHLNYEKLHFSKHLVLVLFFHDLILLKARAIWADRRAFFGEIFTIIMFLQSIGLSFFVFLEWKVFLICVSNFGSIKGMIIRLSWLHFFFL